MGISKASLLAVAALGFVAAGCQSSRMGGDLGTVSPAPSPLPAAPSGRVTQNQLPPTTPSQFPTAPTTGNTAAGQGNTQMASLEPAAGSVDLTAGSVAGVWNASLNGQTCKIATPQTKFGQGYRAGPLRCPGELANLASWSVNGKQLSLFDATGSTVATLYSSSTGRFDGQTSSGSSVSLSR
ncbi:MAG: AprI/Inh family metalloprotease inhibitor [Phyllobacterium sp.]